jgi:hypothetical protein
MDGAAIISKTITWDFGYLNKCELPCTVRGPRDHLASSSQLIRTAFLIRLAVTLGQQFWFGQSVESKSVLNRTAELFEQPTDLSGPSIGSAHRFVRPVDSDIRISLSRRFFRQFSLVDRSLLSFSCRPSSSLSRGFYSPISKF